MTDIILHNLLSFIFIISIIVFVHEFGHYYIAKICGVKIEQFSIGFGKEIFGFNDKHNTRWKFLSNTIWWLCQDVWRQKSCATSF